MKKIIFSLVLLLAASTGILPARGDAGKLYDCETFNPHGYPHGWGFWCDKQSKKPDWKVISDAAEGRQALQITFYGCKSFQGVSINLPPLPDHAECFTFWIKTVSGKPPSHLELVELSPDGKGREFFAASFALPEPGVWKKITVPFSAFRHTRSENAPDGNLTFDRGRKAILRLIGYTKDAGALIIDDLRWECSDNALSSQISRTADQQSLRSRNLLPGEKRPSRSRWRRLRSASALSQRLFRDRIHVRASYSSHKGIQTRRQRRVYLLFLPIPKAILLAPEAE